MEFLANYGAAISGGMALIIGIVLFIAYDKLTDEVAVADNTSSADATVDTSGFTSPKNLVLTGLIISIVTVMVSAVSLIGRGSYNAI